MTETKCIAIGCRSWRTRPCKHYLLPDPPVKTIYCRRLCLAATAHFSDYNSLSIHTQRAWASGGLILSTTEVYHKQSFLIAQMAQQVSVTNKSQWQHKIRKNANKQHANGQALGSVPQPRSVGPSRPPLRAFCCCCCCYHIRTSQKMRREARR